MDLTGEFEDRDFVTTRGDSRIAITLPSNQYTAKLDRQIRFLVDNPTTDHMMSYLLTKPLKLGTTYGDEGVFKFVLQEVVGTDDDNQELRIANYYKYYPRDDDTDVYHPPKYAEIDTSNTDEYGKQVWL